MKCHLWDKWLNLIIFQKRQNNEIIQRFKRQTTRTLSNHDQDWDFLSSSSINKHEAAAFSIQLEAIAFLFNDLLSEQHSESLRSLTIEDDEHWKIDDILNFRHYQDWIQYKVKWTELNQDNEWYYVDKGKFEDFEEILIEFHKFYSNKSR